MWILCKCASRQVETGHKELRINLLLVCLGTPPPLRQEDFVARLENRLASQPNHRLANHKAAIQDR